jgi:hypothetical protein
MYLFTRSRQAEPGEFTKALEFTVEITATVRKITGREVDAWTAVMSPEVGTIVWSMWAEHLVEIEAAADKLASDSGYMKAVEKADDYFDGPVVDGLASLLHGAPDPDAAPPNYVAVVAAEAANGRMSDAITGGIEVAEFATRVSGQNTMFTLNATGPYGGVAWITGNPDIESLEAGEAALMADPGWLDLVNRVGTAYGPNVTSTFYRRLA